jgi:hypothetical protein
MVGYWYVSQQEITMPLSTSVRIGVVYVLYAQPGVYPTGKIEFVQAFNFEPTAQEARLAYQAIKDDRCCRLESKDYTTDVEWKKYAVAEVKASEELCEMLNAALMH